MLCAQCAADFLGAVPMTSGPLYFPSKEAAARIAANDEKNH